MIYSAKRYLLGAQEAAKIYRHIEQKKGVGNFVTEVSMDETDEPQSPEELLFILAALADEKVPLQTIAPKFTGRFNKGVDFIGDVGQFNKEFEEDVCIIRYCVKKFDAGLHVKTAGTTWLEELIGLAKSGEDGLNIAKELYCKALDRMDELCDPYAAVIDIVVSRLPSKEAVGEWSAKAFSDALKHDQTCAAYNPHFRQLLHVGYKIAAEMGSKFTDALKNYESAIAPLVAENIYEGHIKPIFR